MEQKYIHFYPGHKYIARPKKDKNYFYTVTFSYCYLCPHSGNGIGGDYSFSENGEEYKGGHFPFSDYIFEYA